jgi:hypothetical protein
MPDHLDRGAPQHVVLVVVQGLTGSNDDRVTCMSSQGIKVFHVATDDGIVGSITNDFILEFFPAFHATFDKDLRRKRKGFGGEIPQLHGVVGEAGTQTTQSKRGTKNDRVTNRLRSFEGCIDGGDSGRLSDWYVNF